MSRIVLTGFMGSGKSTIGQLLAKAIGWEFIDIDQQIELEHHKLASRLFATLGETGFREVESSTIVRCLEKQRIVLALGGAAIDLEVNRNVLSKLEDSVIVFLDGDFEILIERCRLQERSGQATYRPLLHKQGLALPRFTTRQEWNRMHAHLTIDVSHRTCETSKASILQHLGLSLFEP